MKFQIFLLLVVLVLGVFPQEVFAPVTSMENDNGVSQTISKSIDSSSLNISEFVIPIIIGIILIGILIYFLKIQDHRPNLDM
jgi:D-alanyl-lipoteichoic acid acyltransferase DltB (MBOAT superfamily)